MMWLIPSILCVGFILTMILHSRLVCKRSAMEIFKVICMSVGPAAIMVIVMCSIVYAQDIKDFMTEQHSIQEAVDALKQGKAIRRAGEKRYYVKRSILMKGKTTEQYGCTWGDDKFSDGAIFNMEDVMANDWIIEK